MISSPVLLLCRCLAFAALIYVGVWLDSRVARTIMFTAFFLAIEGCWWLLMQTRVATDPPKRAVPSRTPAPFNRV